MKEKVEQYAKGEFNIERPQITVSTTELRLSIEAGTRYQGTLLVSATNDCRIKGMVYDNQYQLSVSPHSFVGRKQEITYTFDALHSRKGEQLQGILCFVTDGGECNIPYVIDIVESAVATTMGSVNDMFQFAKLAESNWEEAVQIFASEEFRRTFLQREPMYDKVYRSLSQSKSINQAMEEFLVYTHKKRAVTITTAMNHIEFTNPQKPEQHVIIVNKNTWGYLYTEMATDVSFISLERKTLSSQEFVGSSAQLRYTLLPEQLKEGVQVGHIYIQNVYQKLTIEVKVRVQEEELPQHLFSSYHIIKVNQHKLIQEYLNFRTGKIDSQTYIDKTMFALRNLVQYCKEEQLYKLGILHMHILSGNSSIAAEEFKRMDADQKRNTTDPQQTCYYNYLKALAYKKPETIKYAVENIRKQFELGEPKLFYFWLLLFLDTENREDSSLLLHKIERLYNQGVHSPILFYEVCNLLNTDSMLLRRLDPFMIASIRWGVKMNYVSSEVLQSFVELAARERDFDEKIFHLLKAIYDMHAEDNCLRVICAMLIRGNRIHEEYHTYYALGVEHAFKLIGLHEGFIRSMNHSAYELIPETVLRYLNYSTTLSEEELGYLYANIIYNKASYKNLYGEYATAIENYMESQIVKGRMNEHILRIYRELLKPEAVNPKYAARMCNIIYKRKLICKNKNIRAVIVTHKELEEEKRIPIIDGIAYVEIVTDAAVISLVDNSGNRFVSTISYQLEALVEPADYIDTCLQYNPTEPRTLAYVYSHMAGKTILEVKKVNVCRDILESDGISYATKQQALMTIIKYYTDNYDGEILDKYLDQIDMSCIEARDSGIIITDYIQRGMYRKAYMVIRQYGYGDIPYDKLTRLVTFLTTNPDIIGEDLLTSMCNYLYRKGVAEAQPQILQYLTFHYNSSLKDLVQLWENAKPVLKDVRELEENILAQTIFSDVTVEGIYSVFLSYYQGKHRQMVTKAFLRRMAHAYLIQENRVPINCMQCLGEEIVKGEIRDDISTMALLDYSTNCEGLSNSEMNYITTKIQEYCRRGIVLPFFKNFRDLVELPQDLFLKTYLVVKMEEHRNVIANYSIGTNERETIDFRPIKLEEVIPGYYMKEFIVFHGEQLLYDFREQPNGIIHLIESDGIQSDTYIKVENRSRFDELNRMIISQEICDDTALEECMKSYMKNTHIFEENLTIL